MAHAWRPARPPTVGDEHGERGVLAHYTSDDLNEWQYQGPFLPLDKDPTPECPEVFEWNGWWYLVYSQGAGMQYQVARGPLGPWHRAGRGTIEGPVRRGGPVQETEDGRDKRYPYETPPA